MGLMYGALQLFPFSMLPDTVELDHKRSGLRRDGVFTGVFIAIEKTGFAVGALLVGFVLELAGFVETRAGDVVVQPESALLGIRVLLSLSPALLLLASLPFLKRYGISKGVLDGIVVDD